MEVKIKLMCTTTKFTHEGQTIHYKVIKKMKNKNLNTFVRNDGENDHVHVLFYLSLYLCGKKEKK
jgi:hypothetical protein